jgi:3'-phosphoadenosine 5'-phosphosulfate sulfotransferase (PAPS reductase)/FAD synthetase
MMNKELEKKVGQAVKLLQVCYKAAGEPLEVAYSGGKDSDVILELAKMSGIEYRAIYKNTTIDPPGTIKHVIENGVEIRRPKESFFSLMKRIGYPHRTRRFCCNVLKEYKILDNCVMGIRKCESVKRSKRYSEPTECRMFGGNKKNHVNAIYPILDWSVEDELEFIEERGIKLHSLYYREDGSIDITKRLGCICCPLMYYKKRLKAFKQYPGMVKAYLRCGNEYLKSHSESKVAKVYSDVYEYFVANTFFDNHKDYVNAKSGNLFSEKPDYKKLIEDYFKIELPNFD